MSIEASNKESNSLAQKYSSSPVSSPRLSSTENSGKLDGADVSGELRKFIGDIEDLVKEGASLSGEEVSLARDKIKSRLAEAKVSVEKIGSDLVNQARKGAATTDEYIHQQPWQAIGAGAAVGLVVGFLLARRS
jgi:ElaB/YqjD/DUF883 family membrane-anchored ribosome-binding protein